MIAAAALLAGCSTLWSEDMQEGLLIEDRPRIVTRSPGTAPERRLTGPLRRFTGARVSGVDC